jgi:hypothetical protein
MGAGARGRSERWAEAGSTCQRRTTVDQGLFFLIGCPSITLVVVFFGLWLLHSYTKQVDRYEKSVRTAYRLQEVEGQTLERQQAILDRQEAILDRVEDLIRRLDDRFRALNK